MRPTGRRVVTFVLLCVAFLVGCCRAAEMEPLALYDFDVSVGISEIGDLHMPKGSYVPLHIRGGVLESVDLSLDPYYQPESGRQKNLASVDVTQSGESGRVQAKAEIKYTSGKRVEMDLRAEAYCSGGAFTAAATMVKRSYSSRDGRLLATLTHTYRWQGRILGEKPAYGAHEPPFRAIRPRIEMDGTYSCRRFRKSIADSRPGKERWRVRELNPWGGGWSPEVRPVDYRADPRPVWFRGRYVVAYGEKDAELLPAVERLERFLGTTSETVTAGKLDLAKRQIDQLGAMMADVRKAAAAKGDKSAVRVVRLPTADALDKLRGMQALLLRLKGLQQEASEHVDTLIKDSLTLKLNFTDNVMKGMFKSYLSWSGALPTDPVSGLAGYSLNTTLFDLPRNLKGILETAKKDSDLLLSQVEAVKAMGALQSFWETVRDNATAEYARLAEHIKGSDADALETLHRQAVDVL